MVTNLIDLDQLSDGLLIEAARGGDSDAFAVLYRRHHAAAVAAGRSLSKSRSDAEDLASEAFTRVLRAITQGRGPEVAFRPYLLSAVRNAFYDRVRRDREDASDDISDMPHVPSLDSAAAFEESSLAAAAYASLPERWRMVLWHSEVEGLPAGEIAPMLGLASNSVAALTYRAREGFRQAYLQAHVREQRRVDCRRAAGSLGAYVRDGLARRDRAAVDAHLSSCVECTALVHELRTENMALRAALVPAVVGVPAAAYLGGLGSAGGVGLFAWWSRLSPRQQAGGVTGAAAAVAVAVLALALGGGDDQRLVTPPDSTVVIDTQVSIQPDTVPITPPASVTPTETVPAAPPQTTAPTVPPPATTKPPVPPVTTTPPVSPPSVVSFSFTQQSTAVAGGTATVSLVATNESGRALSSTPMKLSLPVGVTVESSNGAFSCSAGGQCTLPALAVNGTASGVLVLRIPNQVTSVDLGVSLPSSSLTVSGELSGITVAAVPDLAYFDIARGSIVAVASSSMTCAPSPSCTAAQAASGANRDRDDHPMVFVNPAGGAINSSSATLTFGGSVEKAWLTWAGDTSQGGATAPNPSAAGTVTFTPAGGAPVSVAADRVVDLGGGRYVAVADVSGLVVASGSYTVADIQSSEAVGSFAGWSLMVVTADAAQPERLLAVVDPLKALDAFNTYRVSIATLETFANAPTTLVVSAFEGDAGDTGDLILISSALAANGAISGTAPQPRSPSFANTFGVDAVTAAGVTNGTAASASVSSGNDALVLALVGVSINVTA